MAYSNFTLPDVQRQFGLTVRTDADLFPKVPPVSADAVFRQRLRDTQPLAVLVNTEKARSEMLIAPVLAEVWLRDRTSLTVWSGVDLTADPEVGLTGVCDFIVGRGPMLHYVTAPLLAVVEAKNESMAGGMGQCAAEMVGIRRFNEKDGRPVDPVYGVVTTGQVWRFLRLSGTELAVDVVDYSLSDLDRILGILLHMVGLNPIPS